MFETGNKMHPLPMVCIVLFILSMWGPVCESSNILVIPVGPGFNSRLLNLAKISRMLGSAGHNVTFLVNSRVRPKVNTDHVNVTTVEYSIPEGRKVVLLSDKEFTDLMEDNFESKDYSSVFKFYIEFGMMPLCRSLLEHTNILKSLKATQFDLLLVDIADDCNRILVQYFDFPTLLYSNYGVTSDWNIFFPTIPSFVRISEDNAYDYYAPMGFWDRGFNAFKIYVTNLIIHSHTPDLLDELRKEFNMNTSLRTSDAFNNHVIIANIDFALQTPRPLMPHVIPVSGMSLEDPKPLSAEWQKIVDESPHGVVLVSFGTVNPQLQNKSNEVLARVLGRLPQTIIWKHTGPKILNLAKNTHIVSWFPQTDLLAHPGTRLFLTHCGISSTTEAGYYGVPVIAIPYGWEQFRNAAFMVDRAGFGEKMDIRNFEEGDLEKKVHAVLTNQSYKDNAIHVSGIMKDHPLSSQETILYWMEYVIRHKGAKHLINPNVFELSAFQYIFLDVILAVLGVAILALILIVLVIYFVIKMISRYLWPAKKQKQS